jgi:anti-sigma regulatory factor (Ser/Thr protein kinase)
MVADPADGGAQRAPAGQEGGMPAAPPSLEQAFDAGALYQLRAAVAAHASAAGLSPLRVYDVVTAAHEMAANSVRHGGGHGRLRLHTDDQALYCQVSDDGPIVGDRVSGQGPGQEPGGGDPSWPVQHGHGLWLIVQVADQFTIDHGPVGTTATACFAISPTLDAGNEIMAPQDEK